MKTSIVSFGVLLGTCLVGVAQAQVKLQNNGSFQNSVYANTNADGSNASTSYSETRGALWLQEVGTVGQFQAYCIDPKTGTDFANNTYTKTDLNSFFTGNGNYANSGYNRQLTNNNYADQASKNTAANALLVRDNLTELFSYAYADSLLNANNAAAFSMAVWEIMMQDGTSGTSGFSWSAGELRTNGITSLSSDNGSDAVLTKLGQYLTALGGANEASAWSALNIGSKKSYTYTVYYDAASPFSQNFIRATPNQVPVPGSLALAGVALIGLGVARRRTKA